VPPASAPPEPPAEPPPGAALDALRRALDAIPALRNTRQLRLIAQGNSRAIFRGRLEKREIVLKIGFTEWQEGRVLRHDAALRHFRATLGPAGPNRVPEPIGAWPEHRLSAAEYVTAARIDGLLGSARRAERSRLLARVGAWLKAATDPHRRDDVFGGGYWVKRFTAEADRIPDPVHRALAGALVRRLADRARPCAGLILARAPAHGDFRMRNILYDASADAIVAIDFDEWEVLPLARELATSLTDLARREPGADADADRDALLSQSGLPEAERETALPFFETRQILHSVINAGLRGAMPTALARHAATHVDTA
jgi:Ser/Thr protein kinase RdoA (MazF antagonist)